ncbi:hypothetical protein, partial [Thiothrix caldifontis]|uniref:hypothetical protein n=1 Tax=Thiothrix caldifontis TaxID=525918 RepID=UPI001C31DFCA
KMSNEALSLAEKFYLNCYLKGREHFVFATKSYSNPSLAISRYSDSLKSIQSKRGKYKPKLPRNRIDSGESLEYILNSRVDKYLGIGYSGRNKGKV